MKKDKKELKEAIDRAFEKIMLKRKLKEAADDATMEDDEVLVEPIVLLDPEKYGLTQEQFQEVVEEAYEELNNTDMLNIFDNVNEIGEIQDFTNLSDILNPEACPSVECEEDMLADDFDEEITELKEVADSIQPLDENNVICCSVAGFERFLINGQNCNIHKIPLLHVALVTPKNLSVSEVHLDENMESIEEVELILSCVADDYEIQFKCDVRSLLVAGLMTVLMNLDEGELVLRPSEFRGMTNSVDLKELETMFKFSVDEGVGE